MDLICEGNLVCGFQNEVGENSQEVIYSLRDLNLKFTLWQSFHQVWNLIVIFNVAFY